MTTERVMCPGTKRVEVTASYDVPMLTFVVQWFGPWITVSPQAVGTVITSGTCAVT